MDDWKQKEDCEGFQHRIVLDSSFILDRIYDGDKLDTKEFLNRCKFYREKNKRGLRIPNHIRFEVYSKLRKFDNYSDVSRAFKILLSIQPTQSSERLIQNNKDISLYDRIVFAGKKTTQLLNKPALSDADVGYCLYVLGSARNSDVFSGTYDRGIIGTIQRVFRDLQGISRFSKMNTRIDFIRGEGDLFTLVNGCNVSGQTGYDERGNKKPIISVSARPLFRMS